MATTIFSLIETLTYKVNTIDVCKDNPMLNDSDKEGIQQRANVALVNVVEAVENDPVLSLNSEAIFSLVNTIIEGIGDGYYAVYTKYLGEGGRWEIKRRGE